MLDDRAGPRIGQDREPVGDRVLAGPLGQLVHRRFDREDVERRAEPAQRRGPHRRLGDQVMDDALCREIVERLAVAGAGARRIRRLRRRAAAAAGRAGLRRPADCRRRPAGLCAGRSRSRWSSRPGVPAPSSTALHRHHHRRADRLEAEFLLAPPAHPDRLPRPAQRDDRRIGRRVVGAVMAVAARPLHVLAPRSPPDRASRSAPAHRAAGRRLANGSRP